ncbi:MAG: hypothetical protein LWX83_00075 [Anaerolineae bacterium]|nr:hypothetical protein [Anaerolineae bacterium]
MAECECLSGCIFFNDKMADKPATSEMLKRRYCLGDSRECARFMVRASLGKDKVPGNLYPNQKDKALELIKEAR